MKSINEMLTLYQEKLTIKSLTREEKILIKEVITYLKELKK